MCKAVFSHDDEADGLFSPVFSQKIECKAGKGHIFVGGPFFLGIYEKLGLLFSWFGEFWAIYCEHDFHLSNARAILKAWVERVCGWAESYFCVLCGTIENTRKNNCFFQNIIIQELEKIWL